jgi:low temperature requirement protein LtrA
VNDRAVAADDGFAEERRSTPIELLWDLVFVFAVTQVAALLSGDPSWTRFGESMLVLALIWWAWSAFVWAANAETPDSQTLRLVLLVAGLFIFVTGLAVPGAFGTEATLFAVTYAVVRLLHLALYAHASREGNASWAAIAGFAITVLIGMALLVIGSFFTGPPRTALWIAAVAIDYAGPAWLTRERLRGLQEVAVAHFAERYSLFIIICLGESVVTIGAGASREHLDAAEVAAVALALLATFGLWWTYFDRFAAIAEARLREHDDPVLAAADSYSYLHLLLVAGIFIFAAGVKFVVRDATASLAAAPRLMVCGGVALYVVGLVAFGLRMVRVVGWEKLAVAAAAMVLFAVGGGLDAWVLVGALAALLVVLCAAETLWARRWEREIAGDPVRRTKPAKTILRSG